MKYNLFIDHTLLKPESTCNEINKLCSEAIENGFFSVCVNPSHVKYCSKQLSASSVKICTVVGFPLGASTTKTKVFETRNAIKSGASEIDMVINIGWLKQKKHELIIDEIKQIKKVCGKKVLLKVIIETCLLTQDEKILACHCVSEAQADFIKTSTGFSTAGATIEDVKLLRKHTDPKIQVKASGGIKSLNDMIKMIEAGATRIGTSKGVELMNGNQVDICKY